MHLAYTWIVSHLFAKNYQNRWKFDEVLTKTNLLSFLGHRVITTKERRADVSRYFNAEFDTEDGSRSFAVTRAPN